eukprot:scaffold105160_cov18-Tisochrysis_lutea.AAC.4
MQFADFQRAAWTAARLATVLLHLPYLQGRQLLAQGLHLRAQLSISLRLCATGHLDGWRYEGPGRERQRRAPSFGEELGTVPQ